MFKLRNIGLFLFIIAIVFTLFDGRMNPHRALDKSISEFKAKVDLINTKFIPEHYTERVTDTILSNGYNVKIKTKIDMLSSIEVETKKDNIITKEVYRHHTFEIDIEHPQTGILRSVLDQSIINKSQENLVLRAIYVDEEASLFKEGIYFKLHFLNPHSKNESVLNLIIDNRGNYKIAPQNVRT